MSKTSTDEPDRLQAPSAKPARLGIEAVIVVAAVVLALVLVGHPKQLSLIGPGHHALHPAAAGPTPRAETTPAAAQVRFNPGTRQFSMDGLQGTLPAGWFLPRKGSFDLGTPGVGGCFGNACDPNQVGPHPLEDNIAWGAEFQAVRVYDPLTGNTINQTADKILTYWTRSTGYYLNARGPITIQQESKQTRTTNLPRPARIITADLHYHKPGLPTRYDHLYLLVVDGSLDDYTAYLAVWSNNAPADTTTTIQNSINSLQVN
jgi:hypothetical protein